MKYSLLLPGVLLIFSCQPQEQTTEKKPYTQQDTVRISPYYCYDREIFNHIVDGFPNLYQYPPLHPDSAFAIKSYTEYFDKTGEKQCIDFGVTAHSDDFYALYADFLRQKNKTDEAKRRQLQGNFEALVQIYRLITFRSQMQGYIEGKTPAMVQYSLYLWHQRKTTDSKGFEQRKEAYLNHLNELKNDIVDTDFRDFREKAFNRYMYGLYLETDFDIEQCKAFEKLYGKR
ncbi:hypothetical protein [Runella limosa]|uniref:hypothetical protein n=1 Tax=Runella limosa TaxID=370978 RepID=UPI0012F75BE2|nr:hypothetical protein [Runella limosa]